MKRNGAALDGAPCLLYLRHWKITLGRWVNLYARLGLDIAGLALGITAETQTGTANNFIVVFVRQSCVAFCGNHQTHRDNSSSWNLCLGKSPIESVFSKMPCPENQSAHGQRADITIEIHSSGNGTFLHRGQLSRSIRFPVEAHKALAPEKLGLRSRADFVRYAPNRGGLQGS